MTKLGTAIKIAAEVHETQTDKSGECYTLHPIEVMNLVRPQLPQISEHMRENVLCVAVLHDTIEDFDGDPTQKGMLRDKLYELLGDRAYSALEALTRQRDESYDSYIERISRDWIARIVKIADLTHNMNVGRLPEGDIGDKDFERWDKYRRALVRLRRED